MLSELNSLPPPPPAATHYNCRLSSYDSISLSKQTKMKGGLINLGSAYDLKPILLSEIASPHDRKRMRNGVSCSSSSSSSAAEAPSRVTVAPLVPVVVVDTQEAKIHLVHALMACTEVVQKNNLKVADALVKQISVLVASQGGAMQKISGVRILCRSPRSPDLSPDPSVDASLDDLLHLHFYESYPYLKFANFMAIQAILEAFADCRQFHIIDFRIKQGM